jgi:hypothetical protein
VQVYPISFGANFIEKANGKIVNCSGSPCGKLTSNIAPEPTAFAQKEFTSNRAPYSVMIYDLLGRKHGASNLNNGVTPRELIRKIRPNAVYIFTYFDEQGQFLYSEKKVAFQ